jgi:glycosyltransferase involved in cell wall biosynthesis
LRVLILNHNPFESRGTYFRVRELARHLVIAGHEATIVATSERAHWRLTATEEQGVTLVRSPSLFGGPFRTGWDIWDTLRRIGYVLSNRRRWDLIHAFDCRPTVILPALALSRFHQVPLVIDWADWWGRGGAIEEREGGRLLRLLVRGPETWFEERFRTKATYTTVISDALAQRAESLGVPADRIVKLGHGSDTDSSPVSSTEHSRVALNLSPEDPVIGSIGALHPADIELLIQAFRKLRARHQNLRLIVAGNPVTTVPSEAGIISLGYLPRDRFLMVLGACDFFLLPLADNLCNRARFPGRVRDYFLAGRPVVATPVGEVAELIARHGVGLVGSMDDGEFLRAASELLEDDSRRQAMGARAREFALTEYSWANVVDQFIRVYHRALDAGAPPLAVAPFSPQEK